MNATCPVSGLKEHSNTNSRVYGLDTLVGKFICNFNSLSAVSFSGFFQSRLVASRIPDDGEF